MAYQAKVAVFKKNVVKQFVDLLKQYPIVGAIDMENLPAPQLQHIRAKMREKGVVISMTKRRLMKLAFAEAVKEKPGLDKLLPYLRGMPALLFANENPFVLYKTIKKNQSPAPAKAGQIAPDDIIIPAGPTSFAPGPIIGELGALGIKSKVQNGKIAVLADTVVCKEGEVVKPQLAGLLVRFGINPMKVGLNLLAVYEDGDILTKKVLNIDEDAFMADLESCASWAFNLAMEAAWITDANKELLIQKAYNDAKALATAQDIICSATVEPMLAKAEAQMKSLQSAAKIDVSKVKEVKAEPKVEAPKEEVKQEAKVEVSKEKVEKKEEPEKKEEKVEKKDDTDKKVAEMVEKTKKSEQPQPSADDLLKDS